MYNRGMMVSIIIPVYNAGKYLERCLKSVLRAIEYFGSKAEVILVDNGSTDRSLEIAKGFQQKYPKIISTLKCQTRGASAARNYGAKKATGNYLWFVDADDAIAKEAIAKLVDKAEETSADLVMMSAKRLNKNGRSSILSAVEAEDKNYKSRFVRYGMGPWQVLIRRAWWEENGFKFREGIIHEDMEMMSALILFTKKFANVSAPLYLYYDNPNSVLHKTKFDAHIFDIFPALEGLYERFRDKQMEKKYHDELEWFFIWNLLIDAAKDFGRFPEGRRGFKITREYLKKYFPRWRRNRFLREKSWRLKLRVRLNYLRNR